MVINSLKHNCKSPVTMDYHAGRVIPASYIVYRKVSGIFTLDSFGMEFGLVTIDGSKQCVVRRMINGNWQHWESIRLADYLN